MKYIIVYKSKENENWYEQWKDKKNKTEFLTYDEALNYIKKHQKHIEPNLEIMQIRH